MDLDIHGVTVRVADDDVRMAALRKGLLPLHAVAFTYRGSGIAATGASGAGKTAVLLSMLAAGAEPVASEWVFVSPDGDRLVGVSEPVRVKPSHVERWAALKPAVRRKGGLRRRVLAAARPIARPFGRIGRAVDRRLHVDLSFDELRRDVGTAPSCPGATFDTLIILEDADVDEPSVTQLATSDATDRVARLLDADLDELHMGDPATLELRALLARHLATKAVFLVRHRQPTPFGVLRDLVERTVT